MGIQIFILINEFVVFKIVGVFAAYFMYQVKREL